MYKRQDRHPDSRELLERQERDLVKIGLSQKKGIELVEVVYDDQMCIRDRRGQQQV